MLGPSGTGKSVFLKAGVNDLSKARSMSAAWAINAAVAEWAIRSSPVPPRRRSSTRSRSRDAAVQSVGIAQKPG
jgi:hypothetical protein